MRLEEILTEDELDEINWKKGLATAAAVVAAIGSLGTDGGVFVGNSADERYWA